MTETTDLTDDDLRAINKRQGRAEDLLSGNLEPGYDDA